MRIVSKQINCEGVDCTGQNQTADRSKAPVETITNFCVL